MEEVGRKNTKFDLTYILNDLLILSVLAVIMTVDCSGVLQLNRETSNKYLKSVRLTKITDFESLKI